MRKTTFQLLIISFALSFASYSFAAPDLMHIYELSLKNDPQLKAAQYSYLSTSQNQAIARARFLPTLAISASEGYSDSKQTRGAVTTPSQVANNNRSINLTQPIYRKADYEAYKQAKSQIAQANANLDIAMQNFLFRVADAYFNVLRAKDALEFTTAEETAVSRQLEQARQRFEVGLTAITDVHEARATFDGARARVIVGKNTLDDSLEALRELTGSLFETVKPIGDDLPLKTPTPNQASAWEIIALDNNPSIKSREFGMRSDEIAVDISRAGHWPTLDLSAAYSTRSSGGIFGFDSEGSSVGITLNVPIFSGFSTTSLTRQARFIANQSFELLDQERRSAVRQTRNAFRGVIAGISEVGARQQAEISATSALEATEAGFEVGTRTIVDTLLSQRTLFSAKQEHSRARYDYLLNHLRLHQSAGTLHLTHLQAINQLLKIK